jgi:hypothetical protein
MNREGTQRWQTWQQCRWWPAPCPPYPPILGIIGGSGSYLTPVGGENEGEKGHKDGKHGNNVGGGQPHVLHVILLLFSAALKNPGKWRSLSFWNISKIIHLKVHKREKFFVSDFEFFIIL